MNYFRFRIYSYGLFLDPESENSIALSEMKSQVCYRADRVKISEDKEGEEG